MKCYIRTLLIVALGGEVVSIAKAVCRSRPMARMRSFIANGVQFDEIVRNWFTRGKMLDSRTMVELMVLIETLRMLVTRIQMTLKIYSAHL